MIRNTLVLLLSVCLCASPGRGGIVATGDVSPADPAAWTISTGGYVGWTAAGMLTIDDGSDVVSYWGFLGDKPGAMGTVSVNGQGSTWTVTRSVFLGREGDGKLEIINGGTVTSGDAYMGFDPGSTGSATVNGQGSSWTEMGYVWVGREGDGKLEIINGGAVTSLHGYLGAAPGSTGTAIVSGQGSTWTRVEFIHIGMEGDGKLEIIDGGSVTSEWAWAVLGLGQNSTASAIVSGQGSSWTGMGFFLVGVGGAASVEITNGASVRSEEGNVGMDSGSTGTVTVSGAGSTWSTHFELCVGLSGEGSLAIADGGLVSVRGGLSIDSNRDGDSYLTMATGGMLALKGNAAGSLGEFLGLIDGTDDIRYWDDSVRAWADITGATAGEDYTLAYLTEGDLAGYTVLTVTAGLPTQLGDTNDDDIIDDLDLANLVAQFGSTPGDESADFNGDGFVGLEDFAILRAYLGSGVAAAAPEAESPAATPEPASAVLLLLGLGAVIRHRKK